MKSWELRHEPSLGTVVSLVVTTSHAASEVGLLIVGPTTLIDASTAFIAGTTTSHIRRYSCGLKSWKPSVSSVLGRPPLVKPPEGVTEPSSVQSKELASNEAESRPTTTI